jgi:hypothetical protein
MSSSKPAFFFSSTQSVDDLLGDVFSFTWASYVGLRELWWQVRGFRTQFPEMHISDIEKKFLSGLPLPGGIDLQRMCIKMDWSFHEQEFAKWILFESCTLYEGWAEKICADIFTAKTYEKFAKALQFPTGSDKKGKMTGYKLAVNEANLSKSPLMAAEFLPTLAASKLNCWPRVEEHLVAYRYFKECRNAFIHSDGRVTQDVLDWLARLTTAQAAQPAQPSPFRKPFALPQQAPGERIALNMRDCVLFAGIVRKLICTFDASLSVAAASEVLLERRLRSLTGSGTSAKWISLPNDPAKKEQRVHRMLAASRIPEPTNFSNVMTWMQSKSII